MAEKEISTIIKLQIPAAIKMTRNDIEKKFSRR